MPGFWDHLIPHPLSISVTYTIEKSSFRTIIWASMSKKVYFPFREKTRNIYFKSQNISRISRISRRQILIPSLDNNAVYRSCLVSLVGGRVLDLVLLLLEVVGADHHGGQGEGDHDGQQEERNQHPSEPAILTIMYTMS